ncbi:hypothetical protein GCM10007973_07240 [Polymorphobacter multimanifer]|uniref:Uncharacterized protein (DUF885 family) n=1 Tax=Polymorphobacter multimanifer TaxID=1070431 RepID=A0A841L0S0_9SPHN|nr:DUF885 family protein [Polymorphobacter multimanifer]MBB6225936.1 uncharacterized protein (DUF885 family) [Polymorphobacter multimanifer]GGI72831.1 hypothetical protein GCM10007973_07240 [Polymorphobacter multimanifer]
MRTFLAALLLMPAAVQAQGADAQLKAIYEAEWAWRGAEFGQVQDGLRSKPGPKFAGQTPADWDRRKVHWQGVLKALDAVPTEGLSREERLNKAVLSELIRADVANIGWRTYEAPLNSDSFFWGRVKPYSALDGVEDYRRYLGRLGDVGRFFDENIANMRAGMKRGYTVPRVSLTGRDKTIEPFVVSGAENPLMEPFARMPDSIPAEEQAKLRAEAQRLVDGVAAPAFARLLGFMRTEYMPAARTSIAASALPDGAAFYEDQIREYTTLDLTADEIHAIGLTEVARIDADMKATIAQTGFKGSFPEFLQFLRTDPQFYARSPRELLGHAAYAAKRMDGKLKDVFTTLPRFRFTIVPVPDAIAPIYTSGRGGLAACQFNTYDLKSRPLYNLTALVLHECAPGHSHQAAMALEAPDRPAFRRESYFSGYGEGWGLYTEWLGTKLGMYETPYEEFGRETFEMWRAVRLVIDTGMHSKGWSREQAIEYLASHTALARLDVENEVDRYISWPGQALAYKLGELRIRALRAEAEAALGSKFDQRPFHDALLNMGSVPLPVMESEMRAWIAAEKGKTSVQ